MDQQFTEDCRSATLLHRSKSSVSQLACSTLRAEISILSGARVNHEFLQWRHASGLHTLIHFHVREVLPLVHRYDPFVISPAATGERKNQ